MIKITKYRKQGIYLEGFDLRVNGELRGMAHKLDEMGNGWETVFAVWRDGADWNDDPQTPEYWIPAPPHRSWERGPDCATAQHVRAAFSRFVKTGDPWPEVETWG